MVALLWFLSCINGDHNKLRFIETKPPWHGDGVRFMSVGLDVILSPHLIKHKWGVKMNIVTIDAFPADVGIYMKDSLPKREKGRCKTLAVY